MDKLVGKTKDAGFQIGVRRTLPITKEEAWERLMSPDGLKLWLGDIDELKLEKGQLYGTSDGSSGEVRVVKPQEQLRMTWQRKGWEQPSTVQIRLLSASTGTTVSFHQEKLADSAVREEMKLRWERAIAGLSEAAGVRG
ncbi:hypothetical protein SK3146_04363 [Paenibacillus konkukensis]|uniref:Activator of Hsp90 ATPase homologue 1/2-like C-terminal domain-containing protein n=1 Tax=Paenibacillus konkukensis TaxID=2020716 RepID=A0ABY4RS82_9BACL|nr:SRPBCC domain-containing protein [Paenibacillus konkukensis]UQZ85080.1 hypothetical protein SK3146_04363 [Paenibacillus konkukensis]